MDELKRDNDNCSDSEQYLNFTINSSQNTGSGCLLIIVAVLKC
jgi:hypothetical protein